MLRPRTDSELREIVRAAQAPLELIGRETKRRLGRPVAAETVLDLSVFSGIIAYEPEELYIEAGAATPLAEIEQAVADRNQMLAFEPPDLSDLLGTGNAGSIGGIIACNLSGSRRLKAGAARDHVLGVTGVNGLGETIRTGARVVKNVTGYDLPKLMAGSYGTLMAFTSVVVKTLPKPAHEETLVLAGLDDGAAVRAMSQALGSSAEVSAAAHVPGEGTYLRLEGIPASIDYRREKLQILLGGESAVLDGAGSAALWRRLSGASRLADHAGRLLWRLSVPPMEAAAVIARIAAQSDCRYIMDWAGGLIWLDLPFTDDAGTALVRGALTSGHATLMRAPAELRARVDVFQPQTEAVAALAARLKASFDPRGLFNPGRMYRGL